MSLPEPVLAILPQAVAAVLAAVGLRLFRAAPAPGEAAGIGWDGLLLSAGFAGAVLLLYGWNGWMPGNVDHRPLLLAAPAAVLAVLAGARWWLFAALALVHVAIATPLLLQVSLREWSAGQAALWLPLLGAGWAGLILLSRLTAERLPTAALPAWAGALAVAGYIIADPAASMLHGFACAGAAVAAGVLALAHAWWGDRARPVSTAVTLAATAPMWWLLTHSLAYRRDGVEMLPAAALLLFALAPLAAWAAWPLRGRRWLGGSVAFIIAAAIAAGALLVLSPPLPADTSGW